MAIVEQGRVKFFNAAKGFGFIVRDAGGKDVFIHFNDLPTGTDTLYDNQRVEFEVQDHPKGIRAKNLVVLTKT